MRVARWQCCWLIGRSAGPSSLQLSGLVCLIGLLSAVVQHGKRWSNRIHKMENTPVAHGKFGVDRRNGMPPVLTTGKPDERHGKGLAERRMKTWALGISREHSLCALAPA